MSGQDDKMIDESELHGWADGQLSPERMAAVEAALEADPALARKARAYMAQNDEIRALYGAVASEPVPPRLRPYRLAARATRRRWMMPVAASVAWLAIGLSGGWFAKDWVAPPSAAGAYDTVARDAVSAHRVYAVEVRHPVEVTADQEAHLVKWLSNRLGHDVRSPDLSRLGFALVGGRLLPAAEGEPAAQFMYEDTAGRRLTLYVARNPGDEVTAFRYEESRGLGAFIWLDPEMGYAITGELPREPLLEVSRAVYETYEPVH